MLKNLISYVKDDDYLIGIYKNFIYIYNYNKIISINKDKITIIVKDKTLKILGESLYMKKMENKELVIEGVFKGIDYGE